MTSEEQASPNAPRPRLNLGPGRPAFSKQTRLRLLLGLAVVVLTAAVIGGVLASSSSKPGGKLVIVPVADRSASPALMAAAEQVGFHPNTASGAGEVEDDPLPATLPKAADGELPVGSVAPAFTLRTPTGVPVSLASLHGKAVLLELFATWCPHCAAEAPHLKALYSKLPHDQYAFLGINADGEDAPSVLAYHIYFGLPFPALLDPNPSDPGSFHHQGSSGPVSSSYKIKLFPTFYVIGPQGRIAWSATGEQPDSVLLAELRKAAGN